MLIKYEKNEYKREQCQIEIEDTKNIFLKGINPYDGLSTYFGIWTNEKYIVIVTLISNGNISYEYSLNKNIYTESDIKKYMELNNNVEIISKEKFKNQLQKVISIVGDI